MDVTEESECILYLWQNRHTVVIGRNQNAFKECKTEQLAADGGFLARRLSGGGSVYHDLGNLNFTFLVKKRDYNVDRQLSVILRALEEFGLHGEKTGRNDICVEGRKFSGNAFYIHEKCCYHHGTILVDVDLQMMSHYLHVSAEKLKANSVSSVKSRVVNLKSLCADMDIRTLQEALQKAFGEIYGKPEILSAAAIDQEKVRSLTQKYASEEWRYGEHMKADYTIDRKFPWGEISILLQLQGKTIEEVQVFSDAMDETIAEVLVACLKGVSFNRDAVVSAVQANGKLAPETQNDICELLYNQEIW